VLGWVDNTARVAGDLKQLMTAAMKMCAGNPTHPHTVTLGGTTFKFDTGPIFENFLNEQAGPGGPRWKDWSPAYAANRKERAGTTKKGTARKFKILTQSGKLWKAATRASSIRVTVAGGLVVGSFGIDENEVPYAAIHDQGGVIPRRFVKPRNKKALRWINVASGKAFFSKGHFVGPITMPKRSYYAVGSPLPPRWASTVRRLGQAWVRGLMAKRLGAARHRVAFEVK